MDSSREELVKIKEVLKEHPKGLSLSDISRLVNMNRHSIAKYMEMLTISGHVEMRSFGPSKVYYLSQRVPISAMLSFSSDIIGTLDRDMNVVQANDALLKFFNIQREELVGQNISKLGHILPINNGMMKLLKETLEGKMRQHSIRITRDDEIRYLRMKLVPSAFDDGTPGVVFIAEDITAEKRADLALRESENRYRGLFESSKDGIGITDMAGRITNTNQAFQEMLGYSKEELTLLSYRDITPARWHESEARIIQEQALKRGYSEEYEKEYIRKDGSIFPISIRIWLMEDGQGRPAGFWGIIRDITERKQAELALKESESRYRAVIEDQTDIICRILPDTTITFVNEAWSRHFGDSVGNVIGKKLADFMPPEARRMFLEELNAVNATNPSLTTENNIRNHDGGYSWFQFIYRGIFDSTGRKLQEYQIVSRDVTERKKAELALKESEARYRTVVEAQSEMILRLLPDTTITFVNDAWCRFFGKERTQVLGNKLLDHVTPKYRDVFLKDFNSLTPDHSPFTVERRLERPDIGERWFLWTHQGFFDGDRLVETQVIGRDITERKRAELAIEAMNVTLEKKVEERTADLIRSNNTIQSVLDTIPNIVFVVDADTLRITYVTPTLPKFDGISYVGMTVDTILGHLTILKADGSPMGYDEIPIIRSMQKGELVNNEECIIRMACIEMVALFSSSPIRGQDDRITAAVSTLTDITGRKQAEEALRESEVRFRSLITNSSDIIRILDRDGRIVYDSPSSEKILGYPEGHTLGRSPLEFIHPDDRERVQEDLGKVYARTNPSTPTEFRIRKADGSYLEVETIGMNMIGVPGVDGIVINTRPIAERKQAEEALVKSEEKYHSLFETMIEGFAVHEIICDEAGKPIDYRFLDINPSFEQITGLKREATIGHTVREVLPGIEPHLIEAYGQVALTGTATRFESYTQTLGRWFEIVVYSPAPGRFATMFNDITERKQVEEKLLMTQAFVDNFHDNCTWASSSGNIRYVNDAACRTLGYMREELVGMKIWEIDPEFSPARFAEAVAMAKTQGSLHFETVHRTKDGKVFPVEVSTKYIRFGEADYVISIDRDITERKQAEQALRESEERFRAVFDRAALGIAVADPHDILIDSNPVYQAMLGYSKEELRKKRIYDITHPDDVEKCRDLERQLNECLIDKYQIDKRYVRKDRQVIWGRLSVSAIRSADGSLKYKLGVMEDITEHKHAEEALRESEASRKMAEEIAGLGYWDIDLETGKGHWSDITYRILGYSPGELPPGAEAWTARINPDDRTWTDECRGKALQNRQPMAFDYRIVRPDGEVRWVHDESNTPVPDGNGRPVKVFGTIQDITGRKAAERRQYETTRLLEAALEASPLAINAIDLDTNVILWNRMAEQVFGWTKEEVLGRPLPTVPEEWKTMNDQLQAMVSSGKSQKGIRISRRRKDGTLIDLTIDASPLYDENGKLLGALGVFQVIGP